MTTDNIIYSKSDDTINNIVSNINSDISKVLQANINKLTHHFDKMIEINEILYNLLKELPLYKELKQQYYGLLIKNFILTYRLKKYKLNKQQNIEINISDK